MLRRFRSAGSSLCATQRILNSTGCFEGGLATLVLHSNERVSNEFLVSYLADEVS